MIFNSVILPLIITIVVVGLLYGIEKARSSKSIWWHK